MWQVNIYNYIKQHLPAVWRKTNTLFFIKSLLEPLQDLYDRFYTEISFREERLILFTGQTRYLEDLLNKAFDSGNYDPYFSPTPAKGSSKYRIYITNLAGTEFGYSFPVSPAPQIGDVDYSYEVWDSGTAYQPDVHIMYVQSGETKVFKQVDALITSVGESPDTHPSKWNEKVDLGRYSWETAGVFDQTHFEVWFPSALVGVVTEDEVRALVDRYKVAGKIYTVGAY